MAPRDINTKQALDRNYRWCGRYVSLAGVGSKVRPPETVTQVVTGMRCPGLGQPQPQIHYARYARDLRTFLATRHCVTEESSGSSMSNTTIQPLSDDNMEKPLVTTLGAMRTLWKLGGRGIDAEQGAASNPHQRPCGTGDSIHSPHRGVKQHKIYHGDMNNQDRKAGLLTQSLSTPSSSS